MSLVIVFSKGAPWRRPLLCNWWLTGCIIVVTAVNIWLCFHPSQGIKEYLMFVDMPTKWEAVLFGAAVLHFVIAYAIEQTNPLLAMFVDYVNLKVYNWYHKKFKRRFDFEEY